MKDSECRQPRDDVWDHIDLLLDDSLRAFRGEVRQFLRTAVPDETRARLDMGYSATKSEVVAFLKKLSAKGWVAPAWPVEYGGTGWSQLQRFVYTIELGNNAAPSVLPFGTAMVGPVLYTFGNQDQKNLYLPRILSGEDFWCQGFSEPGSGSDLASLKTRAEDRGDHYLLNGQKIWTSKAHYADRISYWPAPAKALASRRVSPSSCSTWTRPASKSNRSSPSTCPIRSTKCSSPT